MVENRHLPGPYIIPCTQGQSSVKESISDVLKDETIKLNKSLPAENPREQHNLDIDIAKLEEVIKEYIKHNDSGFKKKYALGIAIYVCNLKI